MQQAKDRCFTYIGKIPMLTNGLSRLDGLQDRAFALLHVPHLEDPKAFHPQGIALGIFLSYSFAEIGYSALFTSFLPLRFRTDLPLLV